MLRGCPDERGRSRLIACSAFRSSTLDGDMVQLAPHLLLSLLVNLHGDVVPFLQAEFAFSDRSGHCAFERHRRWRHPVRRPGQDAVPPAPGPVVAVGGRFGFL